MRAANRLRICLLKSLGWALGWLLLGSGLQAQSVSEQYLLAAANQDRGDRGLPRLHLDAQLSDAARLHAEEMARHRAISHQFADEAELADRAGEAGAHFSLVTENVGEASNSALLHDLWMHSAGHRANLLDPGVDAIGIAVIRRNGQLYAVEDFAHTVPPLTLQEQERTVAGLLARSGLAVDAGSLAARETCQMTEGYAGPRRPGFILRYTSSAIERLPEELTVRLASARYREAAVGACATARTPFTSYSLAVLLYSGGKGGL